ncbi:MAG: chromate resistance regulator ChrB [Hydrocarboniphaga sp.]|nr:chromate resistance protein ChrB domain-containing protein [Hydrocarboniphaga sp.]MDB5972558.1 chromate resistance regulator ChrB [Hydrocarboniphaga sp.]
MKADPDSVEVSVLQALLGSRAAPLVIDVRRVDDIEASGRVISGSLRRAPDRSCDWVPTLPRSQPVVVYCEHGRWISQSMAGTLREAGVDARYLTGGYSAWSAAGGLTRLCRPSIERPTAWVTRERPKIDRIACPWLIRRFIDPLAQFHYVSAAAVLAEAERLGAEPYDVPGVDYSHDAERCSFDAFIRQFDLRDPALDQLATIVRGADTSRLDLAPQAAGLLAISLGLSATRR